MLAYLLLGAFVLPWYLIWLLPFAALASNEQWARLFLAISVLVIVAYQYTPGGPTVLTWALHATVPATQLVAVAGAITLAATARKYFGRDVEIGVPSLVTTRLSAPAAMRPTRRP